MKRFTFLSAVLVALYLSCGLAYGQHGHAGGGSMAGEGVGPHGNSGLHSDANDSAAGGHATSSTMASTNPGNVLDHNTHLASKLESLLNLSGPNALTTLKTDASGFKNFGQFMAAVHVSHNLGIPFSELQAKMTGPNSVSLGKAIQQLKPDVNAKAEAKKATAEANKDAKETS